MRIGSPSRLQVLFVLGHEFLALLWSRKRLALGFFLTTLALGSVVLARRTPLYEASMQLLVTRADRPAQPEDVQAEIALLKSFATAAELDPANEAAPPLTVTALEQARGIRLVARGSSPTQAAQQIQTLFQKYQEQRQQRQQTAPLETTLRQHSTVFEQKLDAATAALQSLDSKHNFLSRTSQQDLLLKQLSDAQQQAEAARTEKAALEPQIATLRRQLAAQPEQIETGSVTKYGTALDKLKEELSTLEMQRTELRQKYQPQHRLLRDAEQRIAQVQELIAREEQNPPREHSFALNETRRRIVNDLLQMETRLAALEQREQQLRQLAADYQARFAAFQRTQPSTLERERALNEEAYLLYQKKAQEAELNAVLHQSQAVQVRVVEEARAQPQPINAKSPGQILGLLCVGSVLALGGVLAVESLAPRVRTESGLQQRLGLNVLARLPAAQKAEK